MKTHTLVFAIAFSALAGCQQTQEPSDEPATAGSDSAEASSPNQAATPTGLRGTVVETMSSGGYTYVKLDTGAPEKIWAAGPTTAVEVGDAVGFAGGMVMNNFESKTLKRVFDRIYFVGAFNVGGASKSPAAKSVAAAPIEAEKITKAPGGMTVAEIFTQSASLAGKTVKVRGKVVKYNRGIMGRNWLHVQDGTGAAGSNDITVTTQATAKVGDIVTVEGVLATNKDFGAGYTYPLIVEDAKLEQ